MAWHIHEDDKSKPIEWKDFPDRIHIGNDNYKTDKTTFTKEEIKNAGYIEIPDPPKYEENNPGSHLDIAWYFDYLTKKWAWSRDERGAKITEVLRQREIEFQMQEWKYARHARETRLGKTPKDDIAVLDAYFDALCKIPEQEGFPYEVEWPHDPDDN